MRWNLNRPRWIGVLTVLATATLALGQTPKGAMLDARDGVRPSTDVNPQQSPLGLSVLYDSLFITNGATYNVYNGNAHAGRTAFGNLYDLRLADDFLVFSGGYTITKVTGDYLCLLGVRPRQVYIRVYEDAGGLPGETPIHEVLATSNIVSTPFVDTVFGWSGMRVEVSGLSLTLGEGGPYWIDIQPVDTTSAGDWYWQVRDNTLAYLAETHMRDGELGFGLPGYGTTTWTSSSSLGYGGGYAAMKIEGNAGRLTVRTPQPGIAGQNNTTRVYGCEPGATVRLYYSFNTGSTLISGCPGHALNLRSPFFGGNRTADGSGVATWTGFVGAGISGRTVYHQAYDTSSCSVSALMVYTYP